MQLQAPFARGKAVLMVKTIAFELLALAVCFHDVYITIQALCMMKCYVLKYEGIVNVDSSIDLKYYAPIFR